MPGQAVDLGPFLGGWNNRAELSTIADDELSLLDNFEVDTDGTLKSRPAIVAEESVTPFSDDMTMLGFYVRDDNETFLVVATATDTRIYQLSTKAWTTIWASVASGFVQYDNKIVLISAAAAGGYWEAGSFTATPTMPQGDGIVFYQGRFWAWGVRGGANATTVWFSNLTVISPASSIFDWDTATDFFTVSPGDGQWITKLVADRNMLLIFRNGSTYQFTFPTAPIAGTLRMISPTIGVDNTHALVPYEGFYFAFSAGTLYQFINYQFYALSAKKIIFERASLANPLTANVRVSIFGRRVIVWFYGATYVYNIVTTTWSSWTSETSRAAHFMAVPQTSLTTETAVALATTGEDDAGKQQLWRIEDDVLGTGDGEPITCRMRTKAYGFGQNATHKRLYFWTVSIASASGLEATLNPVSIPISGTTWNDMNLVNWNDLGTWNNPLIQAVEYSDDVDFPTAAPVQATVKLIARGIRFLLMYAEIVMQCDGTSATSPSRIYAISPVIGMKADVAKKVS